MLPLHPGWQSIQLIDPSMQVLASTSGVSSEALALDPEWVRDVIASGRPSISGVMRDPASGQVVVSLGVPVRRGGRLKYVLGARVYARLFGDILQWQKTPADGGAALMDHKLVIAARTRNEDLYVGEHALPEFQARSAQTPEGSWRTIMREGMPAYSAWSRSPLTRWTVGIALPAAPIDDPVRRSFIALVAKRAWRIRDRPHPCGVLGRRLIRAEDRGDQTAAAVARGEPIALFHSRIAEVHDLAQGLREAAAILETRLHERDRAQADADRHKAALLERGDVGAPRRQGAQPREGRVHATVSHELRTPLNAIYGWLAMLRSGALDPPARRARSR